MKKKSNYYAPTPVYWRKIGDSCLAMIPVAIGIVATAPNLSGDQRFWWGAGLSIGLAGLKALTNLKTVHKTDA